MTSLFVSKTLKVFTSVPENTFPLADSTVLSMNTDSTKRIVNFSDRLCGVELVLDLIIINSAGCLFLGAVPTLSLSANLPSIFLAARSFILYISFAHLVNDKMALSSFQGQKFLQIWSEFFTWGLFFL